MSRGASAKVQPAAIVHLLALHPEVRDSFPVADAVACSVLWGA